MASKLGQTVLWNSLNLSIFAGQFVSESTNMADTAQNIERSPQTSATMLQRLRNVIGYLENF